MQVLNEQDILKIEVRKAVIEDIKGGENRRRKDEAYKRYQVYKDNTKLYVIQKMLQWFDWDTVREMAYALCNVSVCRKIIDKLARVYSHGVQRTVVNPDGSVNDELTSQVEGLSKELDFNSKMKKVNRFLKLNQNVAMYTRPILNPSTGKYCLKLQALPSFLYDVIESHDDREKALCYVLSPYHPPDTLIEPTINSAAQAKIHGSTPSYSPYGNNIDEKIADSPGDEDADREEYIWWSDTYHFTTDKAGVIVSLEGTENPIATNPLVEFALDQDNSFWATGGSDLVDGSVLINSVLTHTIHVGVVQGYGQFYATGKNLPASMKLGPNKGIKLEYDKDNDPVPALGFLSANPPLDQLRGLVEMYTALLLTTNNLSTSGVAVQLGQAQNAASGVALMIDKAESMEDVHDQAQIFRDREGKIWEIIGKWIEIYKSAGVLDDYLMEYALPEDIEVELKFPDQKPLVSESEKLDALAKRKDLGLNQNYELLMLDDPSLTAEAAKAKLADIMAEKMKAFKDATAQPIDNQNGQDVPSNDQPGKAPAFGQNGNKPVVKQGMNENDQSGGDAKPNLQ